MDGGVGQIDPLLPQMGLSLNPWTKNTYNNTPLLNIQIILDGLAQNNFQNL